MLKIHILSAEELYCSKRKTFYLLCLQQFETSWYTALQPFTALSVDPFFVTPVSQRGEKGDEEQMIQTFCWEREEGDEIRSNQGFWQTELLREYAHMLVLILARNLHVLLLQPRHTHTRAIFPIHVQNQIATEGKFEIVRKHVSQTKLFNRLKVPLNDGSR